MTSLARTCILICFAVAGTLGGNWVFRRERSLADKTDTADAPDSLVASLRSAGAAAEGKGTAFAAFELAAREPGRLPELIREMIAGGEGAIAEAACLTWAQADPAGLAGWLESRVLPAAQTKRLAFAAFSAWVSRDADDALAGALRSLHPVVREAGVLAAFEHAARKDFAEGCRILQRAPDVIPATGDGKLRGVGDLRIALALPASVWRDDLIARWFAGRPPADEIAEALPMLSKLPPIHRAHAIREHVRHLAAADLNTGLAALQENLAVARGPGLGAFIMTLPWPDAAAAWDWCVVTLDGPDLPSVQREILLAAVAKNAETARAFLDALPEGPLRTEMLTRAFARAEWQAHPSDFADWAEETMTPGERRRLIPPLIEQWKVTGTARARLNDLTAPPPPDPAPEEINPPPPTKENGRRPKKKAKEKEETGEED